MASVLPASFPLLARNGHATAVASCLLLGEDRKWLGCAPKSQFDPKRTLDPLERGQNLPTFGSRASGRGISMKRREFIALLGGAALGLPLPTSAQQPAPGKWHVGILLTERGQKLIRQGLLELGYAEGKNLVVDARSSPAGVAFAADAAELVALNPDVLVTAGTQAALALRQETKNIPIVMTSSDPVGTGLIASLANPGGNITGFSLFTPEISGKRIELLREVAGGVSDLAILWNSSDPTGAISLKATQEAAKLAGLKTTAVAVQSPDDFESAFAAIEKARPGGLVILPSPLIDVHAADIAGRALDSKLPSIYPDPSFPRAGGLMSYGPNFLALIHDETAYIDKIFKGSKPADLPVQQPTKFELIINLKTAKALGMEVSPTLLARADEVIE
jgi:putative tryptophan/tyrosine transport system substrate-binding protein